MLIPKLKGFDCIQYDPISQWIPESDADVYYSLCLHIGPDHDETTEFFDVDVVTPHAINERNLGKALGQHVIVVNPYSWGKVLEKIHAILEQCPGDNWNQQSELLAKHFRWEYENYRCS